MQSRRAPYRRRAAAAWIQTTIIANRLGCLVFSPYQDHGRFIPVTDNSLSAIMRYVHLLTKFRRPTADSHRGYAAKRPRTGKPQSPTHHFEQVGLLSWPYLSSKRCKSKGGTICRSTSTTRCASSCPGSRHLHNTNI